MTIKQKILRGSIIVAIYFAIAGILGYFTATFLDSVTHATVAKYFSTAVGIFILLRICTNLSDILPLRLEVAIYGLLPFFGAGKLVHLPSGSTEQSVLYFGLFAIVVGFPVLHYINTMWMLNNRIEKDCAEKS